MADAVADIDRDAVKSILVFRLTVIGLLLVLMSIDGWIWWRSYAAPYMVSIPAPGPDYPAGGWVRSRNGLREVTWPVMDDAQMALNGYEVRYSQIMGILVLVATPFAVGAVRDVRRLRAMRSR